MRSTACPGALAVAIFVFGVAAAPSASAAPDDACTLLTQAQVSAAVGTPVGAGSHVTPTFLKTCTWTPSGGSASGVKAVTLSFQAAAAFESAKRLMEQTTAMTKLEKGAAANQVSNTSASGIGDDAFYTSTGGNYTGLLVKKGNVSFKVAIYGDAPVKQKEAMEKTLALQALSKL